MMTILVCFVCGGFQTADAEAPEALRQLERAATAFATADIDWSLELFGVERDHRTRIAGAARAETMVERRFYEQDGKVVEVPRTTQILRSPEGDLERTSYDTKAERLVPDSPAMGVDLLTQCIVRDSRGSGSRSVQEALFGAPGEGARTYETQVVDGVHVVTARLAEGGGAFRWWIDPKRGWWPTRVERLENGRVVEEQAIKLKRWGDRWFPAEVEFGYGKIRVKSASFDQPDHDSNLTPEDIGIVAGTPIVEWPQPGQSRTKIWDGSAAIPEEDWERLEQTGQVQESPQVAAGA